MSDKILPAMTAMGKKVQSLVTQAHMLSIVDQETLSRANDQLIGIKVLRQEIGNTFKPMKDKARETVREIQDKWDSFDLPLVEARKVHETGITAYIREQDKKRREAQELIDQKAKEIALKAAKLLEKAEKEKREKAKQALKDGDLDEYQKIVDFVPAAAAAEVPVEERAPLPEAPELDGSFTVRRWKFEVIDPLKVTLKFRTKIDTVALGQYARALKDKAAEPEIGRAHV